jgi:hypothetical protein
MQAISFFLKGANTVWIAEKRDGRTVDMRGLRRHPAGMAKLMRQLSQPFPLPFVRWIEGQRPPWSGDGSQDQSLYILTPASS